MMCRRRRRSPSKVSLPRLRVEKLENLARAFGADARNLAEIGDRGPLDLLQGSEMMQQCTFAGRTHAGNLLQARLSDVLFAQLAVRADHEPVGFVPQPLDEVQHGVARLELDRLALRHEQGFPAGVAVRPLRYRQQGDLVQPKTFEDLPDGIELAAAAV